MTREVKPLNPKRATLKRLRADLARALAKFLRARVDDVAGQIGEGLSARGLRKAKLDPDELGALEAIVAGIDFAGWSVLVGEIVEILEDVVRDGTVAALVQVGIGVDAAPKAAELASQYAVAYAQERAAEMVGMRMTATGALVKNPNAAWQITEGTRDFVRATVREAILGGWTNAEIATALRESYAFSPDRAYMIARTETQLASNAGAMESYRNSGVVTARTWLTAEDDKVTPDCEANGDAGALPLDMPFPSGAMAPPDHPNCRCTVAPVVDWARVDALPNVLTENA